MCLALYTILHLLSGTLGAVLDVFTAGDLCSNEIGAMLVGGTIEFKSWSRHVPNKECVMRVHARDNESRLQLQFTEINISPYCTDSSLKVLDGDKSSAVIEGLPHVICGVNSELLSTESAVTSHGSDVTLVFRTYASEKQLDSNFSLNFISFHDGDCEAEEYTCDNGRCINNTLRCQDLNPCGDNSDCTAEQGEAYTHKVSVTLLVIYALICAFIVIFVRVLYRKRRRHYQYCIKPWLCGSGTEHSEPDTDTGDNSAREWFQAPESIQLRVTDDARSRDGLRRDSSVPVRSLHRHQSVSINGMVSNWETIVRSESDEAFEMYDYPELSAPTVTRNAIPNARRHGLGRNSAESARASHHHSSARMNRQRQTDGDFHFQIYNNRIQPSAPDENVLLPPSYDEVMSNNQAASQENNTFISTASDTGTYFNQSSSPASGAVHDSEPIPPPSYGEFISNVDLYQN